MKKTILTFVILFCATALFAQNSSSSGYSSGNNPHDSLLFDGDDAVILDEPCDKGDCLIKLTKKEHANIIAWRCFKKKGGRVCGIYDPDITVKEMRRQLLVEGDYIRPGDTIEVTGSDPQFSLSWNDGKLFIEQFTVKFRSAQSWVVPKDFCETNKDWDYENGHFRDFYKLFLRAPYLLWIGMKKLVGAPDFEVETERATCGNCRGTQFIVETIGDEDVFKMIDGTMDVWVKKYEATEEKNATEDMQKLNEDFQSGKITLEEYTKKVKEFADTYKRMGDPKKVKVTLEAGYMCKVGKVIGEVVPIPADDDKWWEDENSNK